MIEAKMIWNAYPEVPLDPPHEGESVSEYCDRLGPDLEKCGDTLFTFIIREVSNAKGGHEEAARMLNNAAGELEKVIGAIEDAM